jgi:hypothetical protein
MSSGSLKILGNITITGLAMFFGDVQIRGELSVSSKQAGIATIPKTSTAVTVAFSGAFIHTPIITATSDDFAPWRIRNRSLTGFTIELKDPAEQDITFSWLAISSYAPLMTMGKSAVHADQVVEFHVDADGRPYSLTDQIWNMCIADPYALDTCTGFHQGTLWFAHPDIRALDIEPKFFTYDPSTTPATLILPPEYLKVVVSKNSPVEKPVAPVVVPVTTVEPVKEPVQDSGTGSLTGTGVVQTVLTAPVTETGAVSKPAVDPPTPPTPPAPPEPALSVSPPTESADPAPAPL